MASQVLIIEDDMQLGEQILQHVQQAGYEATWMTEGRPLTPKDLGGIELVVLDLMLPGTHGFDILKQLREYSDVPVLVLSARDDTVDKIRGLRLGADDYLTKPFWPDELVERVRARLRRPVLRRDADLHFGPLQIDRGARTVAMHGQQVNLTRVELDLLLVLAERPGAAVTRRYLVERILDADRDGDERTLDAHVSRLRKKLGADQPVETVWGIGYRLRAADP